MFERVTYADLQFAGRKALEKGLGEEEGELTYENLQGSGTQEEPRRSGPGAKGWSPRTRWAALGVLGIGLFLLSVTVSLGVRYTQASHQLQQASQDHAAEYHALQAGLEESRHLLGLAKQELNSTKQELNSTKQELHSTMVALWQSRAAGNRIQQQLQHQELLVGQANHSLALLQRERASLMANLSQASSCQQIGCCPRGWTLFRWKCLWASSEWKTWEQSRAHCEGMSSQLLVLREPWSARELWKAVAETFTQRLSSRDSKWFWVGLVKKGVNWMWTWVDGSLYKGETLNGYSYSYSYSYACLANGQLVVSSSMHRFICERAASPEEPPPSDWLWGDF